MADEKPGRLIGEESGIVPGSSGVVSQAIRTEADEDGGVEKLGNEESPRYRAVAVRANCLGVHRPDIQFAVKERRAGPS